MKQNLLVEQKEHIIQTKNSSKGLSKGDILKKILMSPLGIKEMVVRLRLNQRVHLFNSRIYILNEDGIYEMDEEKTSVIKALLKGAKKYEDFVLEYMKINKLEERRRGYVKVQSLLTELNQFIEIVSDEKDCEYNVPRISGCEGYMYPLEVQIALTNRCMHKCKHCYEKSVEYGVNIKLEHICRFLDKMDGYVESITLTGGEPFLYRELNDILDIYSEKFDFRIITSGYWGNADVSDEMLKKFNSINLSIYGASEKEHDEFTGVEGSYSYVSESIKRIYALGIELHVQTQAQYTDFDYLNRLVKNCIILGIKELTIGQILPVGRAKGKWNRCNEKELNENILKLRKIYEKEINILHKTERKREYQIESEIFKCGAGRLKWHVCEDGEIIPCALVSRTFFNMGNINDEILPIKERKQKEIWEAWKENKNVMKEEYRKVGIEVNDVCENIGNE